MVKNIDLSKVKKEYLALVCLALIGMIVFFSYRNVFNPLLKEIKDVSKQIEQKKISMQRAQISPDAFKILETEFKEIKTKIDYYNQGLELKVDVPQILKELNQITEDLEIKIVSVNPLEKKEIPLTDGEESLLQIPIKAKLQCGYHQLGQFINQIENSSNFMKITELQITTDARDIWAHQTELVITSYSLVSQKDLAKK